MALSPEIPVADAERRDRDAEALLFHQMALSCSQAAAVRERAALARHQAALDREASGVDELTGMARRRSGLVALRHEIERCRRAGVTMVLGILHVDGLREVNEAHSHFAGDEVLRTVSALLRASLRSHDIVLRYGGDEFVYSLAGAEPGAAEARFDMLSGSLATASPGNTVTAGFAELWPGDDVEVLIARAEDDRHRWRRQQRILRQGWSPGVSAATPSPMGEDDAIRDLRG